MGKRRILMVDDEPDLVEIVDGWLSPAYDFVGVFDGLGLMELLERFGPDLVILDVNMPGPNGFTLCRRIRAAPNFSALPVLFLTGCTDDVDYLKGWEVGGSSYLMKPISRVQLVSRVGQLLAQTPMGV